MLMAAKLVTEKTNINLNVRPIRSSTFKKRNAKWAKNRFNSLNSQLFRPIFKKTVN